LHWQVELVADDELDEEWEVVEIDGEFTVLARESAVNADPGRITTEVIAVLRSVWSPTPPASRHHQLSVAV
jgi:hypothetical protein